MRLYRPLRQSAIFSWSLHISGPCLNWSTSVAAEEMLRTSCANLVHFVKKPHQRIVHCVVELLIWGETKKQVVVESIHTDKNIIIIMVIPVMAHSPVSPALRDSVLFTHLCLELVMNWMSPLRSFSPETSEGKNFDSLTAGMLDLSQ